MATKTDQTSLHADHLQKMLHLVFQVKIDASEDLISGDLPGIGEFVSQAGGTFTLDLSGLGECEAVHVLSVTPSVGTATISSSLDSDNLLTLSLDSNQDLTATDVNFIIEADIKRKL